MTPFSLRSLLLAAIVLSNCISWTASRHHYTHNVSGHRSRHRRQGQGLFLSASYVLPGGEGAGWGEWGEVSPCSRTCGGGVASQKRICLHIGADGVPQCSGGDTKYFSCQTQDCPAGSRDFREQQCSEFDDQVFRDVKYRWVPYTQAPNPCELNCMPHGERFYYRHRTKVVDGTRCNDESFDVCVNGTCQPVGCDMMLGSSAREDKCRECRGSGANCQTTAGVLDTEDLRKGYNDMLLIPEGATNIAIAERSPSRNYLAVRARNGTYYLNGEYQIDFPRSLVIAGALWYYERSQQGFAAPDKLRCLGPTNEPLILALLLQDENVGIEYEYSVPNERAPPKNKQYNWAHEEFGPCSAPCGGGYQTRNVSCRSREELELVDEALCDKDLKPPTNQTCNTDACAAQWIPGPWGDCSKRCGEGGTRSRAVHCTQIIANGYPSIVGDKSCFDLLGPKPALHEACNENATCPIWFTGPWKPCDKLCDEGKQKRQVVCYQKNGSRKEILSDKECEDEKPSTEQSCLLQPCEGVDWVLSEWTKCDSCLSTKRTRSVVCATKARKVVNDTFCAYHAAPLTEEPCDKTKLPACDVQWYATQWSKCSVDCGEGTQTRKVFCGIFDGASVMKVDDSRCEGQPKYNDTKECEVPQDKCPSKWFAGPWTACTKKCGGGEQYRRVMCLRGDKQASDCAEDVVVYSEQSCNSDPCNKDELLTVDNTSPPLDDDYEDCVEEEEDYPEVGLDSDELSKSTVGDSTMFSDGPAEGSGMWTLTTAEHESTFDTESTLSLDELMTAETGSTDLDTSSGFGPDTTGTDDFSSTTETDSTSNDTDSTLTDLTDSTVSSGTETGSTDAASTVKANLKKLQQVVNEEKMDSDESYFDSAEDDDDDNYNVYPGSTDYEETDETESAETGSSASSVSGETGETETTGSGGSTLSSESGPTDTSESATVSASDSTDLSTPISGGTTESDTTDTLESGATSETAAESTTASYGTTESTDTTDSNSTDTTESDSTDTTESDSTDTTESDSTDTTESDRTDTTESDSTDTTESDSTDTTESDSTDTTESDSTESTGTTETDITVTTDISSSDTTETTGSDTTEATKTDGTESTETTDADSTESTQTTDNGSTESAATTETGSTEATETTVAGATESTETAETGSTESIATTEAGSTESEATTESGATEATETTVLGSTESTETTESGATEATETTVSASTESSETTETGVTESTETTETGTTEATETTETGSTESTETTETGSTETTESNTGSTESTLSEETGSTESTVEGSTLSSEGTESSAESSTTETSSGTTRWDLSSTVEMYTTTKKTRVCKPRSCVRSEFGCCPDKKTPALGPFDDGCPKPQTCAESFYRCCPDGVSPAKGPMHHGCPVEPCAETLFGCCNSDNKTAAEGNDQDGCPPPPPACLSSEFGCCKDETEATGPEKEGCPETSTTTTPATVTEEGTETTDGLTTPSGSTEASESCIETEFGCCFDNETAATGPELQGCPCAASLYGCCLDGVTTAQGVELEGCVKSCNTSAFGCCPDGETPAHGAGDEGCCLLYPYGCCPDNYKPADGPHLEGCGCQYSRYGCCPDNVTIATGSDNKGCGCQYSEYGCCPDRHSEASGLEFEGCMCHTYQFGCCPDGVTIAQGPNGQGCYCQQSQFGCCGDDQTHAKGPDRQGCDCATSRHGCCLDGTTEATGPKFEGCTDKPLDKQAACSLKFERGPCRNYSVGWFYDTEYGGCSRFWYGGCEGNGNRFGTKEECEDTCVSPPARDVCRLPQIKGACLGYNERWYYDTEREMCTNFLYGGCLGNDNNFESRELCQARCEPERSTEQCSLTIERGSCAGNYLRWGYNKDTRSCEQFLWGGCEGNSNRFSTEAACMLRCNPPGEPQPECSKAQDVGNGTDVEARWSFSQTENRCVPFYYTGSGGNGNKYTTREECQEACPSAFVPELCTLPATTGECYDYSAKYYFDTKTQRCGMFYYGGCGGNENRFDTEQECTNRCSPPSTTPAPRVSTTPPQSASGSEFCFMEIDAGPCNQLQTKWGYNYTRGKCVSFQYGGCGGNQNNFPSEEHCAYYCKPTQDICQLPMLAGPCEESLMRWFYDAGSDSCSQFTYGGCEGNDNRFETREECESRCKSGPASTTTPAPKVEENLPSECAISPELEPCSPQAVGEVWYYDRDSSACKDHQNQESGAECRTTGTHYSQEACERACGVFRNIDVCQYDVEPGPCRNYRSKYYYNRNTSRCEEFAYGGCFGGANRFSSEQECEQVCMTAVDPCTLPAEPGNCVDHIVMWYYAQESDQCNQFVYGGCGGNENKFDSRESCEGRCRQQQPAIATTTTPPPVQPQPEPAEECRTPESLAPCGTNETVFYYDEASRRCSSANIGGCGSSINHYRSEEECERRCGAFRGIDVCRAGLDPGPCVAGIPKFYFDAASGSCREFTYGGCQGGVNRFSTIDECEEVCASAGPAPACLLSVTTGDRCVELPERRWHYDVTRADCLVFSYQGCGGNSNNFRSYDECAYHCRVAQFEPPNVCTPYTEECGALEGTCVYGIKMGMTAEGCTRCECEKPPNCEAQQRECVELRCRFGYKRNTTSDGCMKCDCKEDPCARSSCASTERCVVVPSRDPDTQEVLYNAHCEPPNVCTPYTEECAALEGTCVYGIKMGMTAEGCTRCECEKPPNCEAQQRECVELRCRFGYKRNTTSDGCMKCDCKEDPCARSSCASTERCVVVPSRDPDTQEVLYNAHCESNEIVDCDAYVAECARLQCPYGVQRTRTGRCERCSCVREETNCTLLRQDCERLKCHYGLNITMSDDGCERCVCLQPPCHNKRCPEGERCISTPFPDPVAHETRYYANCMAVNKPGVCPASGDLSGRSTEGACRQDCSDDAECRGVMKCCARGCSQLCVAPDPPTTPQPATTHAPDVPRAPEPYTDNDQFQPQVEAAEGGKATLRCFFHGNPPPKITWRFGEVTVDGNSGRYRLLSDGALEIISLFRNDSGVYICVAQNDQGTAQQQVTLTVADPVATPAAIAGAAGPVTGELGQPLVVRCQAYGYPPPTIYWYRGHGGEMVPYSNALYEARGQVLQILRLTMDTVGEYECQAYNGEGSAATWRVVVQAFRPPGETRRSPYLVEREVAVTPRAPAPPTTTEKPFYVIPPYIVPVHTTLPSSSSVSAGGQLSLPCEVDGYPEPEVRWTKDDVPLATNDRMLITGSRLTIDRAEVIDSGVYSCTAANAYSSHSSAARVVVQEMSIPASCVDNPTFANCALIVQSRFCVHKYYSKFCCKSCVEAGQLDPRDALMQADQSFFRK